GHGDRSRRHRREIGEPAFADLLPPAGFVQVHDNVGAAGFEIRRGIVKCEMAVFSDADKRNINRRCEYRLAYNANNSGRVVFAIDRVITDDSSLANQAILKVFAEAGWVSHRKADIFIELEHLYVV